MQGKEMKTAVWLLKFQTVLVQILTKCMKEFISLCFVLSSKALENK